MLHFANIFITGSALQLVCKNSVYFVTLFLQYICSTGIGQKPGCKKEPRKDATHFQEIYFEHTSDIFMQKCCIK